MLLAVLLLLAAWGGLTLLRYGLTLPAEGNAPRVAAGQPIYVALLGVDEREHDTGRSDTLILLRVDPTAGHLDLPYPNLHIDIPAGRHTLDGKTALHYVRLRYDRVTNSDIARIERQQKFLQTFAAKLASPATWLKAPALVRTLRSHMKTNIPEGDQFGLALALLKARNQMQMQMPPGAPDDSTGD